MLDSILYLLFIELLKNGEGCCPTHLRVALVVNFVMSCINPSLLLSCFWKKNELFLQNPVHQCPSHASSYRFHHWLTFRKKVCKLLQDFKTLFLGVVLQISDFDLFFVPMWLSRIFLDHQILRHSRVPKNPKDTYIFFSWIDRNTPFEFINCSPVTKPNIHFLKKVLDTSVENHISTLPFCSLCLIDKLRYLGY